MGMIPCSPAANVSHDVSMLEALDDFDLSCDALKVLELGLNVIVPVWAIATRSSTAGSRMLAPEDLDRNDSPLQACTIYKAETTLADNLVELCLLQVDKMCLLPE